MSSNHKSNEKLREIQVVVPGREGRQELARNDPLLPVVADAPTIADETGRGKLRLLLGINVLWFGLSMLFDGLNSLLLPYHLLDRAGGASQATLLGLLTTLGLIIAMVVQPPAGALSDRLRPLWGRRGTIGLGLVLTLPALAVLALQESLLIILLAYFVVQATTAFSQAALQGFIPDQIPVKRRGLASGWKGFMDLAGAMAGFLLLGQLVGSGRVGAAYLAVAAALLVAFGITLALVREPAVHTVLERPWLSWQTFRIDTQKHRPFIWLVTARFLFLLGAYMVGRFLLFFVAARLNLPAADAAAEAGLLLGGLALVTLLTAPPAGWVADRYGRQRLMIGGVLLSVIGVLLLIVARERWQLFLFGSLMALGTAAFSAANWASTADLVPPDEAARFMGIANIGTAGAAAAAGLFGFLVDWGNYYREDMGYTWLFLAAALSFLGSMVAVGRLRFPSPAHLMVPVSSSTSPTAEE